MMLTSGQEIPIPRYMYKPRLGGKFHPRYLPVTFTGLGNTPQVANTGKLIFFLP